MNVLMKVDKMSVHSIGLIQIIVIASVIIELKTSLFSNFELSTSGCGLFVSAAYMLVFVACALYVSSQSMLNKLSQSLQLRTGQGLNDRSFNNAVKRILIQFHEGDFHT